MTYQEQLRHQRRQQRRQHGGRSKEGDSGECNRGKGDRARGEGDSGEDDRAGGEGDSG